MRLLDWWYRWRHGCSQDWIDDCYEWRGHVLIGKQAHWCFEWDGLPIDETCMEWPCCGPESDA